MYYSWRKMGRQFYVRLVGRRIYVPLMTGPIKYICAVQFNVFLEMTGNRSYWDTGWGNTGLLLSNVHGDFGNSTTYRLVHFGSLFHF